MSRITVNASLTAALGSATVSLAPSSLTITPSADAFVANEQSIGTSAEAINVGDIGTAEYFIVKNTDATNYVDISLINDGTTPFIKLKAGQFAVLPLATKVFYAKANTAACVLSYIVTSA